MPIDLRHSVISFGWVDAEEEDHRIWLVPTMPLAISGGLSPDTFAASVAASEYAKLPDLKQNLIGRLELWDTTEPSDDTEVDADVVWQNWTPVEIEIERVGVPAGGSSNGVISWRITFADHRHAWVQPRGGILRDGIGNTDPATLVDNQTLAQACLDAMGASTSAPSSLNGVAPIRELDWTFAHAPTELARILEHTAHCYCPQPVGLGNVQPINTGTLPSFSSDDVIHNITFSALDRRPQAVVITSAPTPIVHTWTDAAEAPPAWQFVAQDPADNYKWKPLASIAAIGSDPQQALRDGLPGASDEHRAQLLSQMYRCIQIDQDDYPAEQASLLREAEDTAGNRVPPYIKLTVALQQQDGAWVDTDARLQASQVIAEAGVLQFEQRLVRVTGGEAGDLDVSAVAIDEEDLKPTFSVEAWSEDKRLTAVWAFNLVSGTPSALDDATAMSYLAGYRPTVAVLNYPELRRVIANGGAASNNAALATAASSYAAAFLSAESATAREIRVRGFADVGISGRVSSIVYDLATLTTTLSIDSWARPTKAPGRGGIEGRSIGDELADGSVVKPRGRQPQQARQRAHRTATRSGQISDRTPIQPASPVPAAVSGWRIVVVEIVAVGAELGIYTGKLRSGKLATTPGALDAADLGALAGTVNAELWCLADIQFGYNSLAAGDVVLAVAGSTVEGDSIVRCVSSGTVFSQAVLCRIEQTGGSNGNSTTACSFTYKARTPDWNGSAFLAKGKELGNGLTPIKPRPTVGAMKIQSGSTGWGVGRWSTGGTFQLLDAFEVLDTEACS